MLHTLQHEIEKFYFCTVVCYKKMHLIEDGNGYAAIYRWLRLLKRKYYCRVSAFVIMPNHFHVMLFPFHPAVSINFLVGECKRFTAYEIVQGLKKVGASELLRELHLAVPHRERMNNKLHQIFKPSFHWHCFETADSIVNGIDYIHRNPVQPWWNLAARAVDYPHSSARFYELNENKGLEFLVHYGSLLPR